MTPFEFRRAVPGDAEALAALANLLEVTSFASPSSFRTVLEHDWPPGTERLVAEATGRIVAFGRCRVAGDGNGWAWVGVLPSHRGHGLAEALYERLEPILREHPVARSRATTDNPEGAAFASRHGYERANVMRLLALDLETAALPEPAAEAVSLREVGAEMIRRLYLDAIADIPSQTPRAGQADEDFRRHVAESEIVDRDASTIVVENGEPVAFTIVIANHDAGRAGAQMTGVRADRRGRGLAQAVKLASLHRARAAGLRLMLAANDVENEAMLAINRKLGFEPSILIEQFEKVL
jgi:GNAT superfamily N-acetyltransferase